MALRRIFVARPRMAEFEPEDVGRAVVRTPDAVEDDSRMGDLRFRSRQRLFMDARLRW